MLFAEPHGKLPEICQKFNGRIVYIPMIRHKHMMSAAFADGDIAARVRARLNRPLVLVGMMGAGKTRIGRALAQALDLGFTDSDDEIEKAAGMSVADIFEKFGEDYFRDGERRVIERLLSGGVRVVATGGGAVMNSDTAEKIWNDTISIWIRAEMPVMLERTARSNRRPLLRDGNPEEILTRLAAMRYPVYGKADIVVESHNGPVEAIMNQALSRLDEYLSR